MKPRSSTVKFRDLDFIAFTDGQDPISDELAAGRFPLPHLFDVLEAVAPRGAHVLDLGAHVGSFALAAAAAGYEVIAVEASPENFRLLEMSKAANGFANLTVVNGAISDKAGTLRFHSIGPYGYVSTSEDRGEAVEVAATTVDGLLSCHKAFRPAFVKLDIEGSEVAAVRGMQELMAGDSAPVLFCESNGHMLAHFGESPSTLKSALAKLGLQLFEADGAGLVPVTLFSVQGATVVDYVAAKALPLSLSRRLMPAEPQVHADNVQLSRLRDSALSSNVAERLHACRALRDAPPDFKGAAEAQRILSRLLNDSDALVSGLARTAA